MNFIFYVKYDTKVFGIRENLSKFVITLIGFERLGSLQTQIEELCDDKEFSMVIAKDSKWSNLDILVCLLTSYRAQDKNQIYLKL